MLMYSAPKTGAPAWEVSPSASMGRRQNQGLKIANMFAPKIQFRLKYYIDIQDFYRRKMYLRKIFFGNLLSCMAGPQTAAEEERGDPMGSDAFKTPPLLLPPPPSESQKREELAIPPPPFAIY